MSIKKNLFYSLLYEAVVAFYPLLVLPYVSRALGKESIGIYSYRESIIGYFMLFAILGISLYGNRSIAQAREDQNRLNRTFCSIYAIQLTASGISIAVYLIYCFVFSGGDKFYALLILPLLLARAADFAWLFMGLEQVRVILVRNVFVRAVSFVLLLVLVKTPQDLPQYFLIMSGCTLFGALGTWPQARRYVKLVRVEWKDMRKHVLPSLKLFLPVFALSGYAYIDRILLGNFHQMGAVGIYDNTDKLLAMPKQLYTVLANVLMARASLLIAKKETDKNKVLLCRTFDYVMLLMVPVTVGIMGVARELVPWYMGVEFFDCILLLQILSPVLLFVGCSQILRTQYYIPRQQDNLYVFSVLGGAVLNIVISVLLIPSLGVFGAAVGTVIAEALTALLLLWAARREIAPRIAFRYLPLYLLCAAAMYVPVRLTGTVLGSGFLSNVLQVAAGTAVYVPLVLLGQFIDKKRPESCALEQMTQILRKLRAKNKN